MMMEIKWIFIIWQKQDHDIYLQYLLSMFVVDVPYMKLKCACREDELIPFLRAHKERLQIALIGKKRKGDSR